MSAPRARHRCTTLVRRRPAAALAATALVLLTGCSSASHRVAPAATSAAASPSAGLPTPTETPTASVAAATAPITARSSVAAAPCATRALGVKTGAVQGAAGSTYLTLDFTNISGASCSLYGYPGVALAGGRPVRQIGTAASRNPLPARQRVTLAAGKVAHVVLQISDAHNYPAAQCAPTTATYLQIYPPAQTTPVYLAYRAAACAKPLHLLTMTVVQPGA